MTGQQRNFKTNLKTSKLLICKQAREQHNGLKEEAARLKRTIDLFNEEKQRLMQASRDFEKALCTTMGEAELAELMEHFEVFADPANQVQRLTAAVGDGINNLLPMASAPAGNLRSMFKKPQVTVEDILYGKENKTSVEV